MIIQAITWQQSLPIRQKVLWPNRPEIFCQIEEDRDAQHFGVFIDKQLVCVASLYSKTVNEVCRVRLRKFAILDEHKGKGIGTKLLTHIISDLNAQGVNYFWCDARKESLSFYQKLGLKTLGGVFYKAEQAYLKVEIKLN